MWVCPNCETENDDTDFICKICDYPSVRTYKTENSAPIAKLEERKIPKNAVKTQKAKKSKAAFVGLLFLPVILVILYFTLNARFRSLKTSKNISPSESVSRLESISQPAAPVSQSASPAKEDADVYYNRGLAYYQNKAFDQAITALTEAIRLNPSYSEAFFKRGDAYDEKENYDHAIKDYTEAIRLNPNYATAYNYRGLSYFKKKDYDQAVQNHTEAIRLNPKYVSAYNYRGLAYFNKKDYDQAIQDYNEALRIDPSYTPARTNLQTAMNARELSNPASAITQTPKSNPATSADAQSTQTPKTAQTSNTTVIYAGFARIQGGTFLMGSSGQDQDRSSDEIRHSITIRPFLMSKYEVMQKEYREITGTNPSYFKGDTLPVENVSWFDALEYCNTRSLREGLTPAYAINGYTVTWNRNADGYRLPTEAEWEYACRAGTTAPYYLGNIDNAGWYGGNGGFASHPVGQKQANVWGLYDMHGNVGEWCWDWYGNYSSDSQTDPLGPANGSERVKRGGSWFDDRRLVRSAARDKATPTRRNYDLGFRLVRNVQ
jgi:formylglycine-generating enzyme required for sulfatase activity/Tfp pilus assembly protein PilF